MRAVSGERHRLAGERISGAPRQQARPDQVSERVGHLSEAEVKCAVSELLSSSVGEQRQGQRERGKAGPATHGLAEGRPADKVLLVVAVVPADEVRDVAPDADVDGRVLVLGLAGAGDGRV